MQLPLLCLCLFFQASEVPRPVLVVEMPSPVETIGKLLHGPVQQSVVQSEIWATAKKRPEFPLVEAGWNFFLQPAGGDAELFVASFAGDGLFLLVMPAAEGEGEVEGEVEKKADWALIGFGHDGDLAQDCFMPPLQMQGIQREVFRGETWQIALQEDLHILRHGNRFLAGSNSAILEQLSITSAAAIAALTKSPAQAFTALENLPDFRGWIDGDALREDDYPENPDNAAASYLIGELHEALRTAPWLAMNLDLEGHHLNLEFSTPASEELLATHAPFFPAAREISLPQLQKLIMEGVFARDLAPWWAGRADFLSERGLNETIEGEGVMKLLFSRDPGADVFDHLEPEIRWLLAPLEQTRAQNLSVEYPAVAMGLRFKQDAPEDLEQAFASAFLSAVTFANFDVGQNGQPTLEMNMKMDESGKLYSAAYPKWKHQAKKPQRYNFSPSMLVLPNGELWISSSLGLLEEIASAPVKQVSAAGMWMEFQMQELMEVLLRDRPHFVANRMLEEGGDLKAAEQFINLVFEFISLIEGGGVRSFLDDGRLFLQLQLNLAP